MIVNMPNDEEMAAAASAARKNGLSTEAGASSEQAARYQGPESPSYNPSSRADTQTTTTHNH